MKKALNKYEVVIACMLLLINAPNLLWAQTTSQGLWEQAAKWKDTNGDFINAHGAGIMVFNNKYYLYGEIKTGKTNTVADRGWDISRVPAGGVSCYSSIDLKNWKNEGVALSPNTTDSSNDLHVSKVIERPKVIYNKSTKKFVMWMHIDAADYSLAHAGVAVSDQPTGPFQYVSSARPNGNMARDMTLFKDDDEAAYLIYSSENNETMRICKLSEDYLAPTKTESRNFIKLSREAPAIFKSLGVYYLVTSGCTGWAANPAMYATADNILKDWTIHENPCVGPEADKTFNAQSTFVVPSIKRPGQFIFMADRWNQFDLQDSRYLWLPLKIVNGKMIITWNENVVF